MTEKSVFVRTGPEISRSGDTKRTDGKKSAVILLLFLAVLYILLTFWERKIAPEMLLLAEASARKKIEKDVDDAIFSLSETGLIDYGKTVGITYGKNGEVVRISLDAQKANEARSLIGKAISEKLSDGEKISVEVPSGSLSGINLFVGRGFDVKVKLSPLTSVVTDLESEFSSCGINQTVHRVFVKVSLVAVIILPGKSYEEKFTQEVTLCENVIMGEVPDFITSK